MCLISVILCTQNPHLHHLSRVVEALQNQSLPRSQWELLVVDHASQIPLSKWLNLDWHPQAQVIREDRQDPLFTRLRGGQEATGSILLYIDHNSVLHTNYLMQVVQIFQQHPEMGAIAGKSLPSFEQQPGRWISQFSSFLSLRDFGDEPLTSGGRSSALTESSYPAFAPWGIGMALRKSVFGNVLGQMAEHLLRPSLERSPQYRMSSGDNEMVLTLIDAGWEVGYFPQLQLTHLITADRLRQGYLGKLNYAACFSRVQRLKWHGIYPQRKPALWTALLRQVRAFFRYQPWRSSAAFIEWRGICGALAGQNAHL